jgi:hypothetical protein
MNPTSARSVIDCLSMSPRGLGIDHCIGRSFVGECSICCDACVFQSFLGPPKIGIIVWTCVVSRVPKRTPGVVNDRIVGMRWGNKHRSFLRSPVELVSIADRQVHTVIIRRQLAANLLNGLRIAQWQHQAEIRPNKPAASQPSWSSCVLLTLQHALILVFTVDHHAFDLIIAFIKRFSPR